MKAFRHSVALGVLLALTGCTTSGDVQDRVPVEDKSSASQSGAAQSGQVGAGASTGSAASSDQLSSGQTLMSSDGGPMGATAEDPLSQRVIYFDYDSAEIKPEFQEVLRAHGAYLAANPQRSVTVEGHTDERGSPGYNLALGERRAQAIKKVLELNGAAAKQVEVVSYGEEKPARTGDTEDAWSQNRRAELTYQR